ncbi:hypothetical protein [Micromonospora carbonacea]|uniref:HK97 gp10 family phage protein n=1 Tax=Micromonospora carbonacea TaxID=47853 RepID=A0A1C4WZH4_9ACTN|nr:hypothetical protein [Micromonospora carbonacea]SCF01554.1 hypothetical protein GA0070563_104128 [Micromonospora carbonacea]
MPAVNQNPFGEVRIDLREIPKTLRKELRPALKKTGDQVAQAARARASWSRRIPGAIRVKVLYGRRSGVIITVNRKKAPHARAYEGIAARMGNASSFRHPLFGDRNHWYTQRTRPFLHPAAQARRAQVQADIVKVVAAAASRRGFK